MFGIPEEAIFVIVFLVIGAIRWIAENIAKKNSGPQHGEWDEEEGYHPGGSTAHSLEDLYEKARQEIRQRQSGPATPEQVREKLHEYQASAPPPLPPAQPTPPKIQKTPAPSIENNPYQLKKVDRPKLTAEQKRALANYEKHTKQSQETPSGDAARTASGVRIREMLQSPQAARDAIILSEILGKPKGAE
jgi:hypothetical protein